KRLIQVRKSSRVFSQGSIEFLQPSNHRVLAYVRQLGEEKVLIVNNLSNSAQAMAGGNLFPRIGELYYLLTLAPFQSFWFRLRRI
ncbi:MAG: alpha-glucosidase C-terminal domain-containing protein, partial [Candidatus Acidiferrales bacterium]